MCTSLEFNEFFGSSFDVPCFVFSSFVVQFSRYRFATALCDSLYSISYSVPFVKGFSKLFQVSFRHFRSLQVAISCFFSRSPCLPCLSGTGSLAELYYITTFFPFCQPLFALFSPFFCFFYPFFSTFRGFFPFFFGCGAELASAPSQNFSRWFVGWICQDTNSKKSFAYIISCPPTTLPAIRYSQPVSVYVKSRGLGKTNQICFSYASLIGET